MVEQKEIVTSIDSFEILDLLSDAGGFGTTYICKDTANNDEKVCVKVFKDMDKGNEKNESELTFKNETMVCSKKLDHPNVLKMLKHGRSFICKNGEPTSLETLFIATPLMTNGELYDYVHACKENLPEPIVRNLMS
jgi:serine/threonine protein kinase